MRIDGGFEHLPTPVVADVQLRGRFPPQQAARGRSRRDQHPQLATVPRRLSFSLEDFKLRRATRCCKVALVLGRLR